MRRKERAVESTDAIMEIVSRCQVMRIGLSEGGRAYIVPLNFGWERCGDQVSFYFHSAPEGRKIDMLRENPAVCFEMDTDHALVTNEITSGWTMRYASVMGEGTMSLIEGDADKRAAIDIIMRRYGYQGDADYDPKVLARTALLKLTVASMIGKQNTAS